MISSTNLKFKVQVFLKPLASFMFSFGLTPNFISILGVIFAAVSGFLVSTENLLFGSILFLLSGFCDMIDGIVARVNGRSSKAGAFLDSFLDRYADFFPLFGVGFIAFKRNDAFLFSLTAFTMIGSFATSYARARAESLGIECKVGLLERPERFFTLFFTLLFGILDEGMLILAILTNFTALQRFAYSIGKLKK